MLLTISVLISDMRPIEKLVENRWALKVIGLEVIMIIK